MNTFNPSMLTLARESRVMTQLELANAAQIPQAVISKIEGGVSLPAEGQTGSLARALEYPESLFHQADRTYGFNASVFFHRKRMDMPAKVLRKLHASLNLTRMRLDRLLMAASVEPTMPLIRMSIEDSGKPELIAAKIRAHLMLPMGPIADLTASLEDAGVVVVPLPFGSSRSDAISEWIEGHPPIIMINSDESLTADRYRWTLAHELGHLVMHRMPSETMEEEANRFAAEFLLPAAEIKDQLRNVRLSTLALLKSVWKVSMGALLERAKQLNTITATQYRYMRIKFGKLGYNTHEPEETAIAREIPSLFKELVTIHLESLSYSLSQLSTLLHMNERECASMFSLAPGGLRIVSRAHSLRSA